MPRQVSAPLHHAMAKSLTGPTQKLHAQAKLLEYLSGLAEHLHMRNARQIQPKPVRANVAACHDYLLALEGKLPSLVSLSQMFQIPVKRLNAEFTDTYGQSIYTFFMNLRLDQARQALLQTDVPMKQLAHRLGYSHVNNFIAAFRNQFGQSPGSLRRGGDKK
jgi:AraC-like DNA-binding protein